MTQPNEPREAENMVVTLVRIETGVGNILEKVTEVRAEVAVHRGQIGEIQSNVQQLQSDAKAAAKAVTDADTARENTAAALEKQNALALAKAKDAVDSEARQSAALGVKTTTTWAPRNFAIAVVGVLIAALGAYAAFKFGTSIPTPLK